MEKSLLDLLTKEKELLMNVMFCRKTINSIKLGKLPESALEDYKLRLKTVETDLLNCRKEIAEYFQYISSI